MDKTKFKFSKCIEEFFGLEKNPGKFLASTEEHLSLCTFKMPLKCEQCIKKEEVLCLTFTQIVCHSIRGSRACPRSP